MTPCEIFTDVAQEMLRALGTPLAQKASMLLDAGEWDQLVNLSADPAMYFTASAYFRDAQVCALFSKNADLKTTVKRDLVAIDKWLAAERQCCWTNLRIGRLRRGDGLTGDPAEQVAWELAQAARSFIKRTLGPLPDWDAVEPRFGPGSTLAVKAPFTTAAHKMANNVTPRMSDTLPFGFVLDWRDTAWGRTQASDPIVVSANRYATVPKNAKTDRSIAVEPCLNVFYQTGVGAYMKKRLKKIGLDLIEGQETHRRMAKLASVTGEYCTLDLSSASDTVSKELVKLLLPTEWFDLLSSLRCNSTEISVPLYAEDGVTPNGMQKRTQWLQKFSSMGNGYTFELETLIFASLTWAVGQRLGVRLQPGTDLFVYGDDIICPSSIAAEVISTLRYFGFLINTQKSFVCGPFRESCGGDYFGGSAVRPYFIKNVPDRPSDWIMLHNTCRALGFHKAARLCESQLPMYARKCRGPSILGDVVLHCDNAMRWKIRLHKTVKELSASDRIRLDSYHLVEYKAQIRVWGIPSKSLDLYHSSTVSAVLAFACYSSYRTPLSRWIGEVPEPVHAVAPDLLSIRQKRQDRAPKHEHAFWRDLPHDFDAFPVETWGGART